MYFSFTQIVLPRNNENSLVKLYIHNACLLYCNNLLFSGWILYVLIIISGSRTVQTFLYSFTYCPISHRCFASA